MANSRTARRFFWSTIGVFSTALMVVGCSSFSTAQMRELFAPDDEVTLDQIAERREEFRRTQSPEAFCWMLANCVENGLPREDIEKVLGQKGKYEPSDRLLKSHNKFYRRGDKVYSYGPDNKGRAYYLVYRDNRLVGFDRKQFEQPDFDGFVDP